MIADIAGIVSQLAIRAFHLSVFVSDLTVFDNLGRIQNVLWQIWTGLRVATNKTFLLQPLILLPMALLIRRFRVGSV